VHVFRWPVLSAEGDRTPRILPAFLSLHLLFALLRAYRTVPVLPQTPSDKSRKD